MAENEQKEKLEITIIGNGYDLSFGKKTSYNDFWNWLFDSETYVNRLIDINSGGMISIEMLSGDAILNQIFTSKKFWYEQEFKDEFVTIVNEDNKYSDDLVTKLKEFFDIVNERALKYKGNNFWIRCFKFIQENIEEFEYLNQLIEWRNVEDAIFEILCVAFDYKQNIKLKRFLQEIENTVFYDKKELSKYLLKELKKFENIFRNYLNSVDNSKQTDKILKNEFRDIRLEIISNANLVINFNYTNTIEDIINKINSDTKTLNIHGKSHPVFGIDYVSTNDKSLLNPFTKWNRLVSKKTINLESIYELVIQKRKTIVVNFYGHSLARQDFRQFFQYLK